ncbi:hypothetical protein L0222_07660 [bacterium]|nr:hypothetical protein [bacterium]MCI0606233.1 hypothetical protein [bacterium]
MAILQVRGIDDNLYAELKELAESENRSVSQQVVHLLRLYLARKEQIDRSKASAQVLLELSGSWKDARPAQQIIKELRKARKSSRKLRMGLDVSS